MLTLKEINDELVNLNDWSVTGDSIVKNFSFTNFKEALDFVNKVGEIAEKHQHHPDFILSGATVRITLTTHSEHGLTKKDFAVARDIGAL